MGEVYRAEELTLELAAVASDAAFVGLGVWINYVAFEPYCRRFWRPEAAIAIGMVAIFVWWSSFGTAPVLWLLAVAEAPVVALFTFVMIRFGPLAAVIALFVSSVLQVVPLTLQVGRRSATGSNQTIGLLVAPTLVAFYASRADQPLFGTIAE